MIHECYPERKAPFRFFVEALPLLRMTDARSLGRHTMVVMIAKTKTASILILTLWTLSFLTIFVVGLGYSVSTQLHLASHIQDRLKTYYLAKAGIEQAIVRCNLDEEAGYTALNEEWSNSSDFFKEIAFGSGYISVGYEPADNTVDSESRQEMIYGLMDESGRININKAPLGVLESLFVNGADVESEEAVDIAQAVVDWRDRDVITSPKGAESDFYEGLDKAYPCKDDDFQVAEELLMVKGMTPSIFTKISDVITVYGDGKLNINTASQRALCAAGLSEELAGRVVEYRRGDDEIDGTEDDNIFTTVSAIREIGSLFTEEAEEINNLTSANFLTVKSDVFRVISTGILKKGERVFRGTITAVFEISPASSPKMLYWCE